ncbi:hypothetical protein ACFROC_25845 [Nocardia tengchongensis]|uniref:hypothetical protein n=1 Tax=Nocardia tengchongensis TaxID=2055889 RepID=UPI00369EC9E8
MPSDVPAAGMLKSYKKVSRWYPALDPAVPEPSGPEHAPAQPAFDESAGPARFPHYIHDAEPEVELPPVPESVRRNHFDGSWSDWMTERETTGTYTPPPRYRGNTVVEFPSGSGEPGASAGHHATQWTDTLAEPEPTLAEHITRIASRRVSALTLLIVAIVLLAIVGGVALYVLNSHGGAPQSLGVPGAGAGSGPIAVAAAYNEMTAPAIIGDHGPTAGVPAG